MHDFDLISIGQRPAVVGLARNDGAIELDGNAALAEAELTHQITNGAAIRQSLSFAVDLHLHGGTDSVRPSILQRTPAAQSLPREQNA